MRRLFDLPEALGRHGNSLRGEQEKSRIRQANAKERSMKVKHCESSHCVEGAQLKLGEFEKVCHFFAVFLVKFEYS